MELTDAGRQHVLQAALRVDGWIVEAHSHGALGDPARFSPTDNEGLSVWIPHIRWRLPKRGYAALVLGHASVDGLAWIPGDEIPVPVSAVRIDAKSSWATTGLSYIDRHEDQK